MKNIVNKFKKVLSGYSSVKSYKREVDKCREAFDAIHSESSCQHYIDDDGYRNYLNKVVDYYKEQLAVTDDVSKKHFYERELREVYKSLNNIGLEHLGTYKSIC